MGNRRGVFVALGIAIVSYVACGGNPTGPSETSGGGTAGLPTHVLAPVFGPRIITTVNQGGEGGFWEFNQSMAGFNRPGGGVAGADDTYAWDANLYCQGNPNADVNELVYPVASGEVVRYGGQVSPVTDGSVLIAHPNGTNPTWWSGYLHMTEVTATLGQFVLEGDRIGRIGRAGRATDDHLHLVVYRGANAQGQLISFNAQIDERSGPECVSLNAVSTGANTVSFTGSHYTPGGTVRLFGQPAGTLGRREIQSVIAAGDGTINASRTLDCSKFTAANIFHFVAVDVATWLRGDFDGNGIIGEGDTGAIDGFLTTANSSLFNKNGPYNDEFYDLNGDGKVDSLDRAIVTSLLSKTGPDDRRSQDVQQSVSRSCS